MLMGFAIDMSPTSTSWSLRIRRKTMDLTELADTLRKVIKFNYITADDYGIKMWDKEPVYHPLTDSWGGDRESWMGAIADEALPDVSVNADNSKNIVEVRRGNHRV